MVTAKAQFQLVAPDDLAARNPMEKREVVRVVESKVERSGRGVRFALPCWSVGGVERSN